MPLPSRVTLSAFSAEKQIPVISVPEQRAQLVLGGDDGDLRPGLRKCSENRSGAQVLGVVHHDLSAPASRSQK